MYIFLSMFRLHKNRNCIYTKKMAIYINRVQGIAPPNAGTVFS
jgi:hypothetical protein